MQQTVLKIDLCGSKAFAAAREGKDPSIRADALRWLLDVSQRCFPGATASYPKGSFYKADGDAIYYLLEKPSVALRGAIEFMQLWFHEAVPDFPDCRVFLDHSAIAPVDVAGRVELTGRAFENIAVVEKGLQDGRVYVTANVLDAVDATMARFTFFETVTPRPGDAFKLYFVDFDDPRTIRDTSLVHALFVAHPKAAEARERVFELFLIEYLLDVDVMRSLSDFIAWARAKQYSIPLASHLEHLLKESHSFEECNGQWQLSDTARKEVNDAKEEYRDARRSCAATIEEALIQATRHEEAAADLPVEEIAEEYLCGVFAEVRMMANYFRSTLQLFDSPPDLFDRFDYLLRRRLDQSRLSYYTDWRRGFISGLREAAANDNLFIAAVFHNVLATYYLNRSGQASPYQVNRLRERAIYLDTNVLYSLLVEASPFHEATAYFIERFTKLGVRARVLPISVWEYEEALHFVERNYDERGPKEPIIRRNPWLYQQFMSEKARYLDSIAVCRETHSIAKELEVQPENYAEINGRLRAKGIELEENAVELSQEEADKMWEEHRNWMTSNKWDLDRYWNFIYQDFPPSILRHDMTCVANLASKAAATKPDALGPRVMFITVDGKLWQLRKRYPFICSPSQFLEFILPYLFLSDIPIKDARDFPNRLLSAQLGTLLVKRPPELTEIAKAYLREPSLAKGDPRRVVADITEDIARALSGQRFQRLVTKSEKLTPEERDALAELAATTLEQDAELRKKAEADARRAGQLQEELEKREEELEKREATITRLQRTLGYWRAQARRK